MNVYEKEIHFKSFTVKYLAIRNMSDNRLLLYVGAPFLLLRKRPLARRNVLLFLC
jgi:hypothetical protein